MFKEGLIRGLRSENYYEAAVLYKIGNLLLLFGTRYLLQIMLVLAVL